MTFDIESLVNGIVNVNLFFHVRVKCVDEVTCRGRGKERERELIIETSADIKRLPFVLFL